MKKNKIGVITVTFNSEKFLGKFFESMDNQDYPDFHTYIIDNSSFDDTVNLINSLSLSEDRYSFFPNSVNVGVAAGNNQGIFKALADGCEWLLLLNNDTTFGPRFLSVLMETCNYNDWRVVVPKIHYDLPAGHIWYGGGGFNPRRGHAGFHVGQGELDRGQFDADTVVDYSPTCAMLVHNSVFRQIGLMDEAYFVYFDDADFCWRLREAGISIGFTAATSLVHKVGGSTGGVASPFTARITARNRLYFLRKYFGDLVAFGWLPIFLLYYCIRYGLVGNLECLKASFSGSFSYRELVSYTPVIQHDE